MKEQLRNELLARIRPYIREDQMEDVRLITTAVLEKYEITEQKKELIVYQGDANEEMLKRFVLAKIARGLSSRTVKYYKESIEMSLNRIGKIYSEITPEDIRIYLAMRVKKDGVTKTTANNERRNLSAFFGWLQTEEILLKNPMAKVEPLKETKKKKKAFSKMEIELMRSHLKNAKETAAFEILLSTWARVTEVVQIRLDEITDNQILIHGKGDKERIVYLNARAQLAIINYLAERSDDNPYLFPNAKYAGDVAKMSKKKKKNEIDKWYRLPGLVGDDHMGACTLEEQIRNLGKRSGVEKAHPHRFRRTGATMALSNGMPLTTVSKLLGHANIGTTQIYLDISDSELETAHEKYAL